MTVPLVNVDNLAEVEGLYAGFLRDPAATAPQWRAYFTALQAELPGPKQAVTAPDFSRGTLFRPAMAQATHHAQHAQQERVDRLIRAYRSRGHRIANLDPLGRGPTSHPELALAAHGLCEADLSQTFSVDALGRAPTPLADIITKLTNTYCRTIGVQFMHIEDQRARNWLVDRMEPCENHATLSHDEQRHILEKLTQAENFETFIHKKFLGAKRFSLEGGESLIPLLETAIEQAAVHGARDMVIGMAHRGRLNVLANIIGKSPQKIFGEFADLDPFAKPGRGDVKYHLGYSSDRTLASGHKVHLSLCFNPSHLEFVGPVVTGRVRARQDRRGDTARREVMGLVIHGDAALPGQGVNLEMLNMGQLPGYKTGGTLHIVVNNQVGFTTPPELSRSTPYATDVARMLEIPIFHVNGEDPESVTQVVRLATAFRAEFGRDVVIDMYCYRRLGHNEGDEPAFTQPVMYKWIATRPTIRQVYAAQLRQRGNEAGGLSQAEADDIDAQSRSRLEDDLARVQRGEKSTLKEDQGIWAPYARAAAAAQNIKTGVPTSELAALLRLQTQLPQDFEPNAKIARLLAGRREMADGSRGVDWGGGEALAWASLATGGVRVRLSGQDSGRGTFSHRHAILYDARDGRRYVPLQHVAPQQATVDIWDSPLSETAVLGFDYGYSLDAPQALVMWEAQFGDFANGAQVIIDQFIASGEAKWQRLSGIVMLLPHGYEGQGGEHSSARLERFLCLAAEQNIQVAYPTTPAQMFHLLRRQVLGPRRKPLVVMTPKSLLRLAAAVSPLDDFAAEGFMPVLPDPDPALQKEARRVLVCAGKIYYELVAQRQAHKHDDIAIVRVEQLYPGMPENAARVLAPYGRQTEFVWVQEEPANMGAWPSICLMLAANSWPTRHLKCVARDASASPAVGSASRHKLEQDDLLRRALSRDLA